MTIHIHGATKAELRISVVELVEWKQTNGQTDGRMDCITIVLPFYADAVVNECVVNAFKFETKSATY